MYKRQAQKRALISDFRRAAEVLVSRGLSPAEAAARLGHERLGDFYLSAPDYWYPCLLYTSRCV